MTEAQISLIGFMGTGKSAVGALLAGILGFRLCDLDQALAERAGLSIPEIFAREGEAGFRARERQLLAEISGRPRQVLATGGGIVLHPGNVEILRAGGPVVALTAPLSEIMARIGQSRERPLLAGPDPAGAAARLLAARAGLYEAAADLVIDTAHLAPAAVAERIAAWYRRLPLEADKLD